MGLKINHPCQTIHGPGSVLRITNATKWAPAEVLVELDMGGRKVLRGDEVWEIGTPRPPAIERKPHDD